MKASKETDSFQLQLLHPMKDFIHSQLRHIFTGLAFVFAILVSKDILSPEEAAEASSKFAAAADLIAGVIAVIITRTVIWFGPILKSKLPQFSDKVGKHGNCLAVMCMVAGMSFCVISCSSSSRPVFDIENDANPRAIREEISGVVLTSDETGKLKAKVDRTTIFTWLAKLTRIASGEDVKDVILSTPPQSAATAGK